MDDDSLDGNETIAFDTSSYQGNFLLVVSNVAEILFLKFFRSFFYKNHIHVSLCKLFKGDNICCSF